MRAMYRAEAELLLRYAEARTIGEYEHRTPEQRRVDALVLIAERLGDVAAMWRTWSSHRTS